MSEKIGMHCYVSGKVQGVGYRASTKAEAVKLGVTGWAENLSDGRVEVMAFGERDQLSILYQWLQQGPAKARVTGVTYEEQPWQEWVGFQTQ